MNGSEVSVARAIRGPVTLITVGILFALNNFTPYGIWKTWPVLLIVFGLLSLVGRGGRPAMPPPPPQRWNYVPPAAPPGGYRGSSYTGPAAPGGSGAPQQPPETRPVTTPGEPT